MAKTELKVDGSARAVEAAPDTPLLYVLTDELGLKGPRFGCGLAQCGSCSVLIDGVETRSCVTPLSAVGTKKVTTVKYPFAGQRSGLEAASGLFRRLPIALHDMWAADDEFTGLAGCGAAAVLVHDISLGPGNRDAD